MKKQGTTADQINAILNKGANVDARDENQKTPLHRACGEGHMEVAMALVDRGADVDARDEAQATPLHDACVKGHINVVNKLLDMGADVNARDLAEMTPLHWACINGNMEVPMALMDRGADVDAKNENQKTPIESLMISNRDKAALRNAAAKYKENIVELFAAVKKEGTTADQINAILDNGAYVNARDVNQVTPLHYASINGNMEVAKALVDRGADIDAKDKFNRTPHDMTGAAGFNKAAFRNAAAKYRKIVKSLITPSIINYLMQ